MTSSNERQKRKGVELRDYKRYLNQTWYIAQAPVYHHVETCQMATYEKFTYREKSKMAAAAILNFGKCKYIRIGYLHQIWWKDASQSFGDDHVINKSKPEVNLRDVISTSETNCVNLSDYKRYVNHIWYVAQATDCQQAGSCKIQFT